MDQSSLISIQLALKGTLIRKARGGDISRRLAPKIR